MKMPFSDKWADIYGDFAEDFKACYGRSPWFSDKMLSAKGITRKDLREAWKRIDEKEAC